ncbi:MAG: hypothetical protein Q8K20_20530 [Gemmobacter sp.]|nr:hypothetical protein [Gemmobacter sp.]
MPDAAAGVTRLRLDTSRHLPEAMALYRRDGWAEISRVTANAEVDFLFEKTL